MSARSTPATVPARRPAPPAGLAAVFLVAACLRPAITSVGPLLDLVGTDTGLSNTVLGLLSSLPLLAFAAVSPLVQGPARRYGAERLIVWALAGLTLGILVRSLPTLPTLWAGTLVLGAAIAIGNVLLPAVVRRDHAARAAQVIAWYSAVLGTAAAIASGIALPVASAIGDGWRWSLVVWAAPAAVAAAIWWRRSRHVPAIATGPAAEPAGRAAPAPAPDPDPDPDPVPHRSVWRSAMAWRSTVYMGLQSTSFYVLVSWLPAIMTARHQSHAAAGWYLFGYQVVGIAAGLAAPLALRRLHRDVTAALVSLPMIAACTGLIAAPHVPAVWVLLAGLSSGSSLVVALSLFSLNADSPAHAAQLSGMGQSVGYLLAAGGSGRGRMAARHDRLVVAGAGRGGGAVGGAGAGHRRPPHPARGGGSGVGAQPRVGHQVVPPAGPELRAPQHALAGETGLVQRALLGHVLDVGRGLDPVDLRGREQVVGQRALGPRAVAPAAVLLEQPDADVERAAGVRRRAVEHGVPAHVADDRSVDLDEQQPGVRAEQAVGGVLPADLVGCAEAEEAPRVGLGPGVVVEVRQVRLAQRPQGEGGTDWSLTGAG